MTLHVPDLARPAPVEYPESDGQPMAENTLQFQWIATIKGELDGLFADDPLVFVAGDHFWYPVEGDPRICAAPDTMVVFGRPKGHRGRYLQWKEGGIAPQVTFEVLSPGNRPAEMVDKRQFYETYGVEEYYVLDPDTGRLEGWRRVGGVLQRIGRMHGWTSPRLGIRFESADGEIRLFLPNGQPFRTHLDWVKFAELQRQQAEAERQRADAEQKRADAEQKRADAERKRADAERKQADAERERANQLAARLRAAGIDPDEAAQE